MPHILKHETKALFLREDEDGTCSITTSKAKATRYATEASAIVSLEDSDHQAEFCPEFIKK